MGINVLIRVVILVLAGLCGYTAQKLFKQSDSFVEQTAEEYIKDEIGLDIDFSSEDKKE